MSRNLSISAGIAVLVLAAACGAPKGAATSGSATQAAVEAGAPYGLVTTIPVGGDGFWDYLSEDTVSHRLYVSHGTNVAVIDMPTDSVVGQIDSLPGVHGLAVAHDLGKGFASDGRENEVAVVDLSTLRVTARVPAGENPDGIIYLPDRHEVWTFNGRSNDATVIDAVNDSVIATIPLSGKPEFAVYDPQAKRVYNNIEDKSEIAVIDADTHQVVATWAIAPGESASGLAIDLAHHRLFTVCENGLMVMLDSSTGSVIGTVPIGDGPDAARFDPGTQLAFASSGGAGTVTIAHLDSPTQLTVVQTLKTTPSARTMTLDPTTHRIYLSAAELEPPSAADSASGRRRRRMVPGSFKVLVYAPQK